VAVVTRPHHSRLVGLSRSDSDPVFPPLRGTTSTAFLPQLWIPETRSGGFLPTTRGAGEKKEGTFETDAARKIRARSASLVPPRRGVGCENSVRLQIRCFRISGQGARIARAGDQLIASAIGAYIKGQTRYCRSVRAIVWGEHKSLTASDRRIDRRPRRGRRDRGSRRPATFELCTELVRPGGRVANVGVHGHSAALHLEKLWARDVTIMTGFADTFSVPQLLKLVAGGRLDTTPFVTHRFPLREMMSGYNTFAAAAETHALKVVLEAEPVAWHTRRYPQRRRSRSSEATTHPSRRTDGTRHPPRRHSVCGRELPLGPTGKRLQRRPLGSPGGLPQLPRQPCPLCAEVGEEAFATRITNDTTTLSLAPERKARA
jgi:hypothetical protein